ncbi:DUF1906 domain-containing protein [Mucilaginibacter paludis]|uniref:Rv2525c-like glycoside hydrolase-like domain-containing protein n=1 Tax=Mucilaginibacter paludis DSM 18603 TaxID=714943 RepID=H1YBM7_9SPHI|nr:DUF1906 domain-containing protein [Mucilaginibacter paludis]EHQ25990.1 protein of unknown function DUF1906 [Mucilaginibacter paludis DSM 18603]
MANSIALILLPGKVEPARPGAKGLDVNAVLTAANAADFKAAGYDFCIRYIPRTAHLLKGNLSNTEALHILNAGLALMAVQHVANPGWMPSAELGKAYGAYAAVYAKTIVGLPAGINVWLDLEEVSKDAASADIIAYCTAWYNEVKSAGYDPGIYTGYGTGLSSAQLYHDLPFRHYWRAYNGPDVANRGFQIIQKTQIKLNGFEVDPDYIQMDKKGDLPIWLSAVNNV